MAHKPMPKDAHFAPPVKPGSTTVEEIDEILARKPLRPDIRDAWLDERIAAQARQDADALERRKAS
jgi:hypothetical protein